MAIEGRPVDPDLHVSCPECQWDGPASDCELRLDDVVKCPDCGEPVEVEPPA